MMKFVKNFRKDEDGAVTVDWVVLTAAVVGLAVAAYSSIEGGARGLTQATSDFLSEQDPAAAAGGNIQDFGADVGDSSTTSGGSTTGGDTTTTTTGG